MTAPAELWNDNVNGQGGSGKSEMQNAQETVCPVRESGRTREERTPKAERCRLAHCPFADRVDEKGSPCASCTGPVVWKDACGNGHGRCRSCTGCPMNGAGLPVCWAACPGPNQDFTTDGESMVALGGMENPDSYVESKSLREIKADADEPDGVRRMLDEIDGEDADAALRSWGFAGFDNEGDEERAARIAQRLIGIDGNTMEMLLVLHHRNLASVRGTTRDGRKADEVFPNAAEARQWARRNCRNGAFTVTEDRRTVAEVIGCDLRSVTNDDGVVSRIFARLRGRSAGDWDSIRARALGMRQTETARLMMITKQAVNKRDKKIAERAGIDIRSADNPADGRHPERRKGQT